MNSIAWTAIQLLFNNFSITFKEMQLEWLKLLKYLSAAYYAFEGMSVVEFRGQEVRRPAAPAGAPGRGGNRGRGGCVWEERAGL
jgi:hypothetical protein